MTTTLTTTMPGNIDLPQVEQDHRSATAHNMEYSFEVFYKIRSAIAATQAVDKKSITPESKLELFFPRKGRRQRIKAFQEALGIKIDLLELNDSFEWAIIISTVATCILFFINWKEASVCLVFTALLGWLANRSGKRLKCQSVKELTEKIVREH